MKLDTNIPDERGRLKADLTKIPEELPILPLKSQVAFPTLNMTLSVHSGSTPLIEAAMKGDRIIGAVAIRNQVEDQFVSEQVFETGTAVKILYATRASDNTTLLVVQGLTRFRIDQWLSEKPYRRARIKLAPEITETDTETEALHRSLRDLLEEVFSLSLS